MADLAASIKARLLAGAQARGEEFERTLARFAAERLLYRLGRSGAGERCVLKGASLLAVWLADPHRATRDVDVLASGPSDDAAIRGLVREVCGAPCPEDALRFDLADLAVETIRAEEGYPGKRARFWALLGSARIRVQLDVGFGDAVAPAPRRVELPTLLPAMPAPRLLAYPPEASLAEKFEAMVKLDVRNSRMKDFHDVWALAGAFEFDGAALQHAVAACFGRRRTPWTEETPRALTPAFYHMPELTTRWRNYLAAGAVLIPPPAQFGDIGERITSFLGPVRDSIVATEPFAQTWPPSGAWKPSEERSR
jgi:hypothetical protein